MNSAIDRVKAFIADNEQYDGSEYIQIGYGDDIELRASDIRAIVEELEAEKQHSEQLQNVVQKFLTEHVDRADLDDLDYGRGVQGSGIIDEMRKALKGQTND